MEPVTASGRARDRDGWSPGDFLLRGLFACTLTLSAFLLFVIQPLTGRLVLPVLGGSAAVWTTSLVFFQTTLVAGYAWAHVSRALPIRLQVSVQAALLAIAAWMFPANLVAIDIPDEPTVGRLIKLLVLLVGLPAFSVAVNGSLLQRWFAYSRARGAQDPTFLFAFSNAGSFAGLLAYPVLMEPMLTVTGQRVTWGVGCALLALLVLLCGATLRHQRGRRTDEELPGDVPLTHRTRLNWFVLGMVPASLLAGVTAYLSTELLPMPLLWVVPLALYLLTFVTSFSGRILRVDNRIVGTLPLLMIPIFLWQLRGGAPLWAALGAHLVMFTVIAALCHGRLADGRPGPARLTEFYLWIAAGGAAGGAINALLAPAIFTTPAEYALMLIAASIVLARSSGMASGAVRVAFGTLLAVTAVWALRAHEPAPALAMTPLLLVLAGPLLRPGSRIILAGTLALVIGKLTVSASSHRVMTARSVFAAVRVMDDWHPGIRALVHGSTVHGLQASQGEERRRARSYFSSSGPIGQVMEAMAPQLAGAQVGIIGLGAGELAAYGGKGQRWTFFEIDPVVVRIAADPALFSYLHDSHADIGIMLGDGRRSILRRSARDGFGLLVLDAFTSDAVPIHLLTVEAFQTYAARLAPRGIIAVHISNRFVDLRPVLSGVAGALGFEGRWQIDSRPPDRKAGRYPSQWVILGPPGSFPEAIIHSTAWRPMDEIGRTVLWSDERATLLDVLR